MKNKFITFFLVILFTLSNFSRVLGEEFIFEISDLEITENGNIYKGNNRGTIRTDSQLKLISDNFEYLKEINRLEANGDVQLFDLNNNITINAQQIFYLKNEEKIFTIGKTLIPTGNAAHRPKSSMGSGFLFFTTRAILKMPEPCRGWNSS